MSFQLSDRSLSRLEGVDPRLVRVVKLAIQLTDTDFGVTEGLRSIETQKRYVELKKSTTMNSKHLDGKAVDLMAYCDGAASWELNLYDNIANAMKQAAQEEGVGIRWGGCWIVDDIRHWDGTMEEAMQHYIKTRVAEGKRPFIDGPHFELVG
jgi:peptidoglycan L-alanyl-D-glutamate endopeptidase CwlK